ncbi:hypothetical protein JNG57_03320 [Mycoplasmopsis bovis]|uniref:Uncharacterized protein n=3 Tax=Mycoplasmopsis bovis TaxID=28903 RepID=A0A2N8U315_MYCBV|nr:hypothetical protein [Mycoplasmopsis bovis]AEI90327.1 hypothetical protein MMB_0615 [Mycoplasmopsis bovis Hubei-1]AFM52006.1 Hypothetical protein Mbov_0655 [Mycoplasmopsis bovis HB0801]AIA34191.1 hypothetical protein K668_03075 [Mycoplasmopsis bovis CQ-W70]AKO50805.1 hypothetical protein AAV31_03245 [Mycoplasmopsis bovis]AQU85901.1 hypothetical protein B0W43_03340 [Mycoplasmopsis bovis]
MLVLLVHLLTNSLSSSLDCLVLWSLEIKLAGVVLSSLSFCALFSFSVGERTFEFDDECVPSKSFKVLSDADSKCLLIILSFKDPELHAVLDEELAESFFDDSKTFELSVLTLLDVVSPSVYEVPSSVLGFSVTFLESSFLTGSLISFSSYFISWSFKTMLIN